jgi:hypothetical protein
MKEFNVEPFIYNGFSVQSSKKPVNYTAKFINWTQDPGIVVCECSDGKERLIPSCCLIGFKSIDYPLQDYTNKQLLGRPSNS